MMIETINGDFFANPGQVWQNIVCSRDQKTRRCLRWHCVNVNWFPDEHIIVQIIDIYLWTVAMDIAFVFVSFGSHLFLLHHKVNWGGTSLNCRFRKFHSAFGVQTVQWWWWWWSENEVSLFMIDVHLHYTVTSTIEQKYLSFFKKYSTQLDKFISMGICPQYDDDDHRYELPL